MKEIDINYINNAINDMLDVIGCRDKQTLNAAAQSFLNGNLKECIEIIAHNMGLPIKINIIYVPNFYNSSNTNKFHTTAIVEMDSNKEVHDGIAAQIEIPCNLPIYGSHQLNGFTITMRLSDNCNRYFDTFVCIVLHELSHLLLHSLMYKEKNNEIYTDITPLLLGFSDIIEIGRKKKFVNQDGMSVIATYGYLSDKQFAFSKNKIKNFIKDYKRNKKLFYNEFNQYKKNVLLYKSNIFKFNEHLKCINKNKKIKKRHVENIVSFHQLCYIDNMNRILKKHQTELLKIDNFRNRLSSSSYMPKNFNLLKQFRNDIVHLKNELKSKLSIINKEAKMLKKYST